MNKQIIEKTLGETPELFGYALRKTKTLDEVMDMVNVVNEKMPNEIKEELELSMLFVAMGKKIQEEGLKGITKQHLLDMISLIRFIEIQEDKKKFFLKECLEELNDGISYAVSLSNKRKEDLKETIIVKNLKSIEMYLNNRTLTTLRTMTQTKEELLLKEEEIKDINTITLKNILKNDEEGGLYEWLLENYRSGKISRATVNELDMSIRVRLYVKSKGEIKSLDHYHWLEKHDFEKAYEACDIKDAFFPYEYKSNEVEKLKKEMKETLENWHENETKQLFLKKNMMQTGLLGFEWEQSDQEKADRVLGIFFKTFENIDSLQKLTEVSINKYRMRNDGYYEEIEKQHGITLKDAIAYFVDEKQKVEMKSLWLNSFKEEQVCNEWMLKVAFLAYTKKNNPKQYKELIKNEKTDLIDHITAKDFNRIIEEEDFYVEKTIHQLKVGEFPSGVLELFVIPELSLIEHYHIGYINFNGKSINIARLKAFIRALKEKDKRVVEKLKNTIVQNPSVLKTKDFWTTWYHLGNGLLNTKQKAEVLFSLYPKEVKNIFLINGFEITDEEELKEKMKEIKKETLSLILMP